MGTPKAFEIRKNAESFALHRTFQISYILLRFETTASYNETWVKIGAKFDTFRPM